jgi:hypothetical protein
MNKWSIYADISDAIDELRYHNPPMIYCFYEIWWEGLKLLQMAAMVKHCNFLLQ